MKLQEIGVCRVWVRDDDSSFHFHPDCYDALKAAWMRGEAFFEGRDCYDEALVVKLGAVVCISRGTPEHMAEASADAEADKLRNGDS